MKESWDSPAIGIDLGTRFSSVAVWQHGQVEIIVNDQGSRKTPFCVAFTESEILIGEAAKNQSSTNPTNTIFDVKNLIGRRYSDLAVENDIMSWPFKVIGDGNDKPKIVVSYKGKKQQFTVEEICSMVLMKMKQTAEAYLCAEVKHAVITVPTYFNDIQRQATKNAGIMAGLNTVRIISESTAATVAYGFCKQSSDYWGSNVLIFNMGGANLDVSFLTINEGTVEFKASSGQSQYGGDDFDENLASVFRRYCYRTYGHGDYSENSKNLLASCERAKRILSNSLEATVCQDNGYCLTISRAVFEFISEDFFKACMQVVKKCLRNAKIDETDVHYVVLVGGSTRIPKVQQMLQNFFCHGTKLLYSINVEEVVAHGAANYAAMLRRRVFVSPTYPFTELHIGVSPEGSFLAPCSKMTRTVKSWVQESSPSLIVKDIDSLLEDLNGSKNFRKSSTSFCSLKIRLLKLLEEVRRKPNDVQLTLQVSQSLTSLYPYLPNHLLTGIKSIEEELLASQDQYLEWSSKEAAISLNVEETGTIQSHLVKFKTDILEMTSSRDYLRSKITGIDKEIATLMDHKSQIEEKLSSVEKDLHKLIHSIDHQVNLARRQSAILAQRREASNFKDKAQLSIEATLNIFASYFKNMLIFVTRCLDFQC